MPDFPCTKPGVSIRRVVFVISLLALVVACASKTRADAADAAQDMQPYAQPVPGSEAAIEMVPIPGGRFMMGSPPTEKDRNADEGPQFEVKIEPFWMGKFEITWDQLDPFGEAYHSYREQEHAPIPDDRMADAVSIPTVLWPQDAVPLIERLGREGGYPAASMSQLLAKQYTKWLSQKTGHFYRLPTEAEWEYAARAGTSTAYSFGDDPDDLEDYAWYFDNSELEDGDGGYRKVGLKKPNAFGLYDMHGNVAEWVLDQYDPDHYAKFDGRTVKWHEALRWPTDEFPRAVRGGGWDDDPDMLRSAARRGSQFNWSLRDPQFPKSLWWHTETFWVGFRIVRPLHEPPEEEKSRYWDADIDWFREVMRQQEARQIRVLVEPMDTE